MIARELLAGMKSPKSLESPTARQVKSSRPAQLYEK